MTDALLLIGIELFRIILCIYLALKLSGDMETKKTVRYKVLFVMLCILIITDNVTNLGHLYYNNGTWTLTDIYLILLYVILRSRHKIMHAGVSILVNHIVVYFDYAIGFLFVTYGGEQYTRNVILYSERTEIKIAILIVRAILSVLIILFVSRANIKLYDSIHNRMLLIVLDIVSYVFMIYLQVQFLLERNSLRVNYFFIILIIVSIVCSVFGAYNFVAKQQEKERMMQIRNELLEKNYQKIYQEQRRLEQTAHDFKNHINLIENYLEEGKYTTAMEYVGKLKKPLETISQRSWSGNKIIDTILNIKFEEARKKEIQLYTEIDVIPNLLLSEYDLCVILSNLLDNAIEACEYVELGKRELAVNVKKMNHLFMIKVVNSREGEIRKKNEKYRTIKSNKRIHGIGLESVQISVDKYQGTLLLEHTEDRFTAIVSIPYYGK